MNTDVTAALLLLRIKLDVLDADLIKLFKKRMKLAERAAHIKLEHGLPIEAPEREAEVLENAALNAGEYAEYAKKLYQTLIALSKERQEELSRAASCERPKEGVKRPEKKSDE